MGWATVPAEAQGRVTIYTTLDVSTMNRDHQAATAGSLTNAVFEASAQYPAVSHYFVQHRPAGAERMIGLRTRRIRVDAVRSIADGLLHDSIAAAVSEEVRERAGLQGRVTVEAD